jgi:mannose-6-phosphate isomerase-like protein (cupin superfamily)
MRGLSGLIATVAVLIVMVGRGTADNAQPYRGDLEHLAKQNADFMRVLFTAEHVQIVAMSLPPNEDIGPEVHRVDRCFFFVVGGGTTMVAGRVKAVKENDVLCVPAGLRHNVRNPGPGPLKLYTIYSPPEHPAGTVHHTKLDADDAGRTHHGPPLPPTPPAPRVATPAPAPAVTPPAPAQHR